MWTWLILFVCAGVVLAYGIHKISRENLEASRSAELSADPPTPVPAVESHQLPFLNLIQSAFQNEDNYEGHASVQRLLDSEHMIATSTIVTGMNYFKANYRGKNKEQVLAFLDEALGELKSRFGDQISPHDLREFIRSQREKVSQLN